MQHWIQSVKDRWKTTSPKVEENYSGYTPSKDFMERRRKSQEKERERLAALAKYKTFEALK